MTEEALLRGIIPAVATTRHGLDKRRILQLLDEGAAGVMTALVAVDDGFVVQGAAVLGNELVHGFQDEIHFEAQAHTVGQDFMGESVQDRGEIAPSALPKEEMVISVRRTFRGPRLNSRPMTFSAT